MKKWEYKARIVDLVFENDCLTARIETLSKQRDEHKNLLDAAEERIKKLSEWNDKNIAGKVILGNMRYNYLSHLEDEVIKFCDAFERQRNDAK